MQSARWSFRQLVRSAENLSRAFTALSTTSARAALRHSPKLRLCIASPSLSVRLAHILMASGGSRRLPVFHMGEHTHKVPMRLHSLNRERLVARMRALENTPRGSIVLLQGGSETYRSHSSDAETVFRQESFFHWAFGYLNPGAYGAIDVDTGRSILFVPRLPESYGMWMGHIDTLEEIKEKYAVDEVHYVDDVSCLFPIG